MIANDYYRHMKRNEINAHGRRISHWKLVGISVGLIIALVALAFRLSPWPGALVIRAVFDHNDRKTLAALQQHQVQSPVIMLANQQYQSDDTDALLDVYTPETAVKQNIVLPTLIWIHGGAWVSGNKANVSPYYKLIASQGFTVIAVNYSLAPEKTYPSQIHQINQAYSYIQANAARFHVDPNKFILAGDSAGAQLSSELAALITNPIYANEVKVRPTLSASQVSGVVLFCGIYKMDGLTHPDPTLPKIVSWGSDVSVWAYSGTRDKSSPVIQQMSPYYHVNKNFPRTFLSGGNGDPLTNEQSVPLAEKLKSLGIDTTTLFYPANHSPSLPHEYQFNLNSDGQAAFNTLIEFLKEATATD